MHTIDHTAINENLTHFDYVHRGILLFWTYNGPVKLTVMKTPGVLENNDEVDSDDE